MFKDIYKFYKEGVVYDEENNKLVNFNYFNTKLVEVDDNYFCMRTFQLSYNC